MRTINNLLQSFKQVDLSLEVENAMKASSEAYLKLQKEQMFSGEKSDGEGIFNLETGSDKYSPSYAKYKGKTGPIDLHDKGDFYREMFAVPKDDEALYVGSTDSKSEMLQERYSNEIFGLATERKQVYADLLGNTLVGQIENAINRR